MFNISAADNHYTALTSSPSEVEKVAQAWAALGVPRSGSNPMWLPCESYLGQQEDDDNCEGYDFHLSTFPWDWIALPYPPPMVTNSWLKMTAQEKAP